MSTQRLTLFCALCSCVLLAKLATCDQSSSQGTVAPEGFKLSSVIGGATGGAVLASSADGMSRYLAPDGPIQPAITMIAGLPMQGAEYANRGITSISSRLQGGAQALSRSAGQEGRIRMPGMDALESSMPASIVNLGDSIHGAIRSKNNFIRNQAERGVQAGNRLMSMMHQGLQSRSSSGESPMVGMANMVGQAQDALMKGGSTMRSQMREHLDGSMGHLSKLQEMGSGVGQQVQGLGRTLQGGLAGAMGEMHKTGEKMVQQIQGNHEKNRAKMMDLMGGMQGSMDKMGKNMHKNMEGLSKHAQQTMEQVTSALQQVVSTPLSIIQNMGSNFGKMMQKGGGGGGSGRY